MKKSVMFVFSLVLLMSFVVSTSALPDLTISKLEKVSINNSIQSTYASVPSSNVTIKVCVKNSGDMDSGPFLLVLNGICFFNTEPANFCFGGVVHEYYENNSLKANEEECSNREVYPLLYNYFKDYVTLKVYISEQNFNAATDDFSILTNISNVKELDYTLSELRTGLSINSPAPFSSEQIETLAPFFINESFGDWNYHPGFFTPNISLDEIGLGNADFYHAVYIPDNYYDDITGQAPMARVDIYDFPHPINQEMLENLAKFFAQDSNIQMRRSDGKNNYLYTSIQQTGTDVSGTRSTYNTIGIFWYSGTKMIAITFNPNSYYSPGDQLLTSYFDKYPSELSIGFFDSIINFFRNLFGG